MINLIRNHFESYTMIQIGFAIFWFSMLSFFCGTAMRYKLDCIKHRTRLILILRPLISLSSIYGKIISILSAGWGFFLLKYGIAQIESLKEAIVKEIIISEWLVYIVINSVILVFISAIQYILIERERRREKEQEEIDPFLEEVEHENQTDHCKTTGG